MLNAREEEIPRFDMTRASQISGVAPAAAETMNLFGTTAPSALFFGTAESFAEEN